MSWSRTQTLKRSPTCPKDRILLKHTDCCSVRGWVLCILHNNANTCTGRSRGNLPLCSPCRKRDKKHLTKLISTWNNSSCFLEPMRVSQFGPCCTPHEVACGRGGLLTLIAEVREWQSLERGVLQRLIGILHENLENRSSSHRGMGAHITRSDCLLTPCRNCLTKGWPKTRMFSNLCDWKKWLLHAL